MVVMVVVTSTLSQTGGPPRTLATEDTPVRAITQRAPDLAGLALEGVGSLLAAVERAVLVLELVHGDGGEGGCGVVLCFVVVDFVDGDCGVDDGGLNGLFLDDGLDCLMDVVVNMLSCNNRHFALCMLRLSNCSMILELRPLRVKLLPHMVAISVLNLSVLNANHVMAVLLREHLAVLDGLHGCVVVILVDFSVDDSLGIFVLCAGDVFMLDGGVYGLVYCCLVLSVLVEEILDCCLCLIHFDMVRSIVVWS